MLKCTSGRPCMHMQAQRDEAEDGDIMLRVEPQTALSQPHNMVDEVRVEGEYMGLVMSHSTVQQLFYMYQLHIVIATEP